MTDVEIKRGYEVLPDNRVRFGIRVINNGDSVINEVEVFLDFSRALFELEGSKVEVLGTIPPSIIRTAKFILKPLGCIHNEKIGATVRYKDHKWGNHTIDMHPKEVHCVCPFLKEKTITRTDFLKLFNEGYAAERGLNFENIHPEEVAGFITHTCKNRMYKVDEFPVENGKILYLAGDSIGEKAHYLLTAVVIEREGLIQVLFEAKSDKEFGINGFLNEIVENLRHLVHSSSAAREIGVIKREQVINIIDSVVVRPDFGSFEAENGKKEQEDKLRIQQEENERLRKEKEERERLRRQQEIEARLKEAEEEKLFRQKEEEEKRKQKEIEEKEKLRRQQEEAAKSIEEIKRKAQEEADKKKKEQEIKQQEELRKQKEEEEKATSEREEQEILKKQKEEQERKAKEDLERKKLEEARKTQAAKQTISNPSEKIVPSKERESSSGKKTIVGIGIILGIFLILIVAMSSGSHNNDVNTQQAAETAQISSSQDFIAYTNSIGMEFVKIPAGEFMMGSTSDEGGWVDEVPVHKVTIEYSYYLGKYEVTQEQWREVMGSNPSNFKGDDLPVESVSWDDAQEFIRKLNQMEGTDKYRLPSEAEWEYACRAGTTTKYSFGDDESKLGDYAWYDANSGSTTHPIGRKKPNLWGLYDMHGNVLEWCQDKDHDNYDGAPSDGSAWESGNSSFRIYRGGNWYFQAGHCRSSSRFYHKPNVSLYYLGFRLVRNL